MAALKQRLDEFELDSEAVLGMHHDNLGIRVELVEFGVRRAIHVVWGSRRRIVPGEAQQSNGGICRKQTLDRCGILFDAKLTYR
jgi:hypothetical protein